MCGLFGLINHKPRKFDRRAFITLGCANDARGGDACGVFIDGMVEYGTEKGDAWFQNWYEKSKAIYQHGQVQVALGHCRKASVGGKAADKAQPVVIRDNDGDIVFCLIHNGTIYNYEELAKKYIPEIDIKGLTDSQVMARIFYYAGYDALGEYRGGGAFVTMDYRDNTVRIFKGASLEGVYAAAEIKEERPLYFAEIPGEGIAFSSIYSILKGLYYDKNVFAVPNNELCVVEDGTLYVEKKYDRSKCYQTKSATVYHGTGSTKDKYFWDDWDDENLGGFGAYTQKPDILFNIKTGFYYIKGAGKEEKKAHGRLNLSSYGYQYEGVAYSDYYKPYYFWQGLLLDGKDAFDVVDAYWKKPGVTVEQAMGLAEILSYNPVCKKGKYFFYDAGLNAYPIEEFWDFPFTKMVVTFKENGEIGYVSYAVYCNDHKITGLGKEKYEEIRDKYVEHIQ